MYKDVEGQPGVGAVFIPDAVLMTERSPMTYVRSQGLIGVTILSNNPAESGTWVVGPVNPCFQDE